MSQLGFLGAALRHATMSQNLAMAALPEVRRDGRKFVGLSDYWLYHDPWEEFPDIVPVTTRAVAADFAGPDRREAQRRQHAPAAEDARRPAYEPAMPMGTGTAADYLRRYGEAIWDGLRTAASPRAQDRLRTEAMQILDAATESGRAMSSRFTLINRNLRELNRSYRAGLRDYPDQPEQVREMADELADELIARLSNDQPTGNADGTLSYRLSQRLESRRR